MSPAPQDRLGPIKFKRDRETKNKVLFREVETNHSGAFYLRKDSYNALGKPTGIVIAVQAVRGPQEDSP